MRYDSLTLLDAQRRAIDFLAIPMQERVVFMKDGSKEKQSKKNDYYVPKIDQTAPAILVQEQAWTNAKESFIFDFSTRSPEPSAILNNVNLPKNNVAAVYAIQILFGVGAEANNRRYFSHGITPNDDSLYNSNVQLIVETSTMIDNLQGQLFRDVYQTPLEFDGNSGLYIINPLRILTGELGKFKVQISLINSISTLTVSANCFISMRLHTVMGQATGKESK